MMIVDIGAVRIWTTFRPRHPSAAVVDEVCDEDLSAIENEPEVPNNPL
jgi:hypothetical protein